MPDAAPERLIQPSPERLTTLQATPDATPATNPDAAPSAGTYPRGAADFTSAAMFDAFASECEALEVSTDPRPVQDIVFRGTNPPPALPAMPNDNIFRLMEGNPEFIDPNRVAESAGAAIVLNLFETLVVLAPGNSPPVPGAAESWEMSPDGRTWTFHIRRGMVWSDGRPTSAHDFVYSWKRGLSPELGSKNAELLFPIKGAEAYNSGRVKTADDVGVRAVDDHTLVVELERPVPYFLDLIVYNAYAPVPRWAIEQHGDLWTKPEHIVTNGPFLLSKWVERDRFELTKNPTYWDAATVKLAGAIIYHTENEEKNVTLYHTGQSHIARPLPPDAAKKYIADGRSDMRIAGDGCIYYYVMRTDRPPFDDARVRRALNLALDKEGLTRNVLGMFQKVATTMVPELVGGFTGYVPPPGPVHDPVEARRLMTEAGYPNGVGLAFQISYNTFEGHRRIAEFASKNWSEQLGIQSTALNMEWKSLLKIQKEGDFQVSRAGWCPDYPDAMTFLDVLQSDSPNNYPAYKNPAFDALLMRIKSETDRRKRNVLLCAAEKGLQRDMPVVPMYQYTRSILIRPEVKGYEPQYSDDHPLKWVRLEPPPPSQPGGP